MGLFSKIREKIEDGCIWVDSKIREIKYKIEDWIGNSGPYNGNTIPDRVNIEKELNKFKKAIGEEASNLERQRIDAILKGFNVFIENIEENFPMLVDTMNTKKKQIVESLHGTITNYVNVHVSENNKKFEHILKMNPGDEKENKTREYMDIVLDNARSSLNKKLEKGMDELYEALSERLNHSLEEKEELLNRELELYANLKLQRDAGEVNEQSLKEQYQYACELEKCITATLEE